jgi:hypothetical protein
MKRKLLSISMVLGLFILMSNSSCEQTTNSQADKDQAAKTELAMQEANRQVGMPGIVNFQEKKLMKQIYELRDQEKLICHAYLFNKMTGKVGQYLGKCIGYGLPYSTQFSNPEKVYHNWKGNGASATFIPQAEPNGLFMPEGLSATWLLLIDPKTKKARPVYIEPEIIVSPFKLHK